jgi:hypothetical protein
MNLKTWGGRLAPQVGEQPRCIWPRFCTLLHMSTHLKLEAPWVEVKEQLKELNLSLTDEDLEYIPGHEEELLKRLSTKLGMDILSVKTWIESVSYNEGKAS